MGREAECSGPNGLVELGLIFECARPVVGFDCECARPPISRAAISAFCT